ncbi:cysteine synthase A [Cohaesibacter sp. ES.047]|uniref:PLP-dependent cysteine synthase family protein n=1 Tax=Cohaesibacter sp. ES.047 TaxID=1798205 RepID=UPI000BB7ECFF|nr:PLP-dependent cysteine synthase family protein [Cohaesibacter sp. ES.047]SNY93370.1 cysteine synthase A [Cohaesibacter sp. ES.047]
MQQVLQVAEANPQYSLCQHNTHQAWASAALDKLEREKQRAVDTHLIMLDLPGFEETPIYFKDESTHPTGSLKHRLAQSLFANAICHGYVGPKTTVIEASSGSTAVSEAYFAQLLGLPFIAVMQKDTSPTKINSIKHYGGKCHLVERGDQVYAESERLAKETNGHYMDQFTNAAVATDWRSDKCIAGSILSQMEREPNPVPAWIVMAAGTGGNSATIGRYLRYHKLATKLCVPDVENSVFMDAWTTGDNSITCDLGSRIEGIGRPRVEPAFKPDVVDAMIKVPDAASVAVMLKLSELLGRPVGPSSGTNFYGALIIAKKMQEDGEKGPIVSVICDGGYRYLDTYHNREWRLQKNLESPRFVAEVEDLLHR